MKQLGTTTNGADVAASVPAEAKTNGAATEIKTKEK